MFGTRPEAIKMAPVISALEEFPEAFSVKICVTAQHREMLDQVLEIFGIEPDFDLNLMAPGQDLSDLTASVMLAMRDVISESEPDLILVHGDTTTTLGAAMAGFYARVPVGHVEAGLRTHDFDAPYPEEFNRQLVSRFATWHFAPTDSARSNLLSEGVLDSAITVTGNTVIDSLHSILAIIGPDHTAQFAIGSLLDNVLGFDWRHQRYVLVTGHRRENFGDGFLKVCDALVELAEFFPFVHFVYPLHLNPKVRVPMTARLGDITNIHLIEPQGYLGFVLLLKHCFLVLTDSGGLQEEAPSLGKPVLVMRETTERLEGVEAGTARIVGVDSANIVAAVTELLSDQSRYQAMAQAHNPYGDGKAAQRIAARLNEHSI